MLYHQKPQYFHTQMYVSAAFLEYEDKILLLQRALNCSSPGLWCEPGGKRDAGESSLDAGKREILEETGIDISQEVVSFACTKYFYFLETYIEIDFYRVTLEKLPEVKINTQEHTDFVWVSLKESLKMNLVEDLDVILKEVYEK